MTSPQTLPDTERVADWPRILATVHPDGSGSLTVNGTERPCLARSVDELRTGMIAHVVLIATRLHRPVRMLVTDDRDTWPLAVRPSGIVQLIAADGTIDDPTGLSAHEGPCRVCRQTQLVTATSCTSCGAERPHNVEAGPRETYHRTGVDSPPTAHVPTPPVPPRPPRRSPVMPEPALPPIPPRLPRAHGMTLTFDTQPSVRVTGGAVLGRNPDPIGGRTPVAIASPGRLLSRTHAVVDVDHSGRLTVTDTDSANGIEVMSTPPVTLTPGVPHMVTPGTTLLLGDVHCTITLA